MATKVGGELGVLSAVTDAEAKEAAEAIFKAGAEIVGHSSTVIGGIAAALAYRKDIKEMANAYRAGNTEEAVGHAIEAMGEGAFVSAGVLSGWALLSLATGGSVAAALGGWLAVLFAVGFGASLLGKALVATSNRTAWEEFAENCFLGNPGRDAPDSYSRLPAIVGEGKGGDIAAKLDAFRMSTSMQCNAARALAYSFKVHAYRQGEVHIEPGTMGLDGGFYVYWRFDLSRRDLGEQPWWRTMEVWAYCYPNFAVAQVYKTSPPDCGVSSDCWLEGRTFLLDAGEGEAGKSFKLQPRRPGNVAPILPYKLSVRACLLPSAQVFQSGGTDPMEAACDDWSMVPQKGPLVLDVGGGMDVVDADGGFAGGE